MIQHIGIVGCSAEGAALCYHSICAEGAALLGPHAHPEVSLHTPSLADYVRHLGRAASKRLARGCCNPRTSSPVPAPTS